MSIHANAISPFNAFPSPFFISILRGVLVGTESRHVFSMLASYVQREKGCVCILSCDLRRRLCVAIGEYLHSILLGDKKEK